MSYEKLGFYRVGFKKFANKALALIENQKTGYEIEWIFNHDIYSKIDWSRPIETPLMDLYTQRARQLREKYDYLVLYYSGGADSTMVLHSFIDNNLFIDEIVMHLPDPVKPTLNGDDLSNQNYYSEVEYAATVHLNKVKNKLNPNTKIKYQDFAKTGIELLERDNWFESSPLCLSVSISGILRQITQEYSAYNLKLQDSGRSIAYVLGVDKPLIHFDGKEYYCYFMDTSTYHYVTPANFNNSSILLDNVTTEFFYWTPDMPEIVVKQAQLIKQHCELNPWAKLMVSESLQRHISEYRPVLHPVIYPDYVCEQFQTEKPSTHIKRPMDNWFWSTASKKVQNNYLETIKYLGQNINSKYMINGTIDYGIAAHKTGFYKI